MATMQKATEKFARTTRDSYLNVADHMVGMQERNVRLAQSIADSSIKELRHQAEANRAMTREVVERVENGREGVQTLAEESLDAYMNFFTPLSPTTRKAWRRPEGRLGRPAASGWLKGVVVEVSGESFWRQ